MEEEPEEEEESSNKTPFAEKGLRSPSKREKTKTKSWYELTPKFKPMKKERKMNKL